MKCDWKECRIGDIVDVKRGSSPRPIHSFISTTGMPWVKIADATSDNSRYIRRTKEFIIEKGVSNSVVVEPETLIVSNSATPGLPKIMKIKACVHDGWLVFSDYKNVTRDYLYYKFMDIRRGLVNLANGSVFQNLKTEIVKDFKIELPPLETQRKIASVLSTLDDKIELNDKINANLEEQARAIFKSWFVDFEASGGKMPEDWKITFLSDIADFVNGYSYTGNELTESDIAMASIKNFDRNGGFKLDGYKEIKPSDRIKDIQYADVFDTLVANTDLTQKAEVIGNAEFVASKTKYKSVVFSMDLVKVVPKSVSKFMIAAILKDRRFKEHCLGYVNGTTVLHLNKKALPEYSFAFPSDASVLRPFDEAVTALYKTISNNIDENLRLSSLRDALLPRLLSGELDVSKLTL